MIFCHQVIMHTQMNYYSSQIVLFMHDVIHGNWTQLHTWGGRITSFIKKQTKCKMISLKLVNIPTPNCFIFTFVKKNKIIGIISTLQIAQGACFWKIQVEIVLDVNHLNLVPCMAIMFPIHSLHLTKMTIETNKGGGRVQIKHHH